MALGGEPKGEAIELQAGDKQLSSSGLAATEDPLRGRPHALELFRQGDIATLKQVYWAHVDRVVQVIRHNLLASRSWGGGWFVTTRGVEDLVQDTFVRAFNPRARLAFDGQRDYWPYLSTIARNVLTDALRSRRRDLLVENEGRLIDEVLINRVGEDASEADPRILAIVNAYLGELPATLAGVYHQRYVIGQSQELAAKALNITRQHLRTLERKLRNGLTRELKRAGLSNTD
jgi:RNA polymerase sigma-70 factor (ECF subfamily)